MENKNKNDVLDAILAAAILGGIAEEAKKDEPAKDKGAMERAKLLREQYDAFLDVGFTEEQATMFAASLLQ